MMQDGSQADPRVHILLGSGRGMTEMQNVADTHDICSYLLMSKILELSIMQLQHTVTICSYIETGHSMMPSM